MVPISSARLSMRSTGMPVILEAHSGGLGHLVVALAHDVGVVGQVFALVRLGHGLLVIAHAVGVQEVEVHQVVLDEVVGDAGHQRGVGARVDGQPLVGVAHDGVVHAVVDHIDLRARALAQVHPVVVRGQAALARLGGAGAEDEHELGVLGGLERAAAGVLAAVHVRRDAGDLRGGVAVVEVQVAAHQVEQAVERARRGSRHAGGVGHVHSLVAVLLDDLLELGGGQLDGLVPADLLELALAALADALHGIAQAVGAGKPAAVAAAAQAGAGLRIIEVRVRARAGIHPHDLVIAHVELERAAAGAVDGAVPPGDLLLGLGHGRGHAGAEERVRGGHGPAGGGQGPEGPARLEERTTT